MPKPNSAAATVEMFLCDEDHIHVQLKNDRGDEMAEIALDFEDGLELVQDLLSQIEQRTGLLFMVIDPDEIADDDGDTIGPVMGSC